MSEGSGRPLVVIDARMIGERGHGIALYLQMILRGLKEIDLPYEVKLLVQPRKVGSDDLCGFLGVPVHAGFLNLREQIEIPLRLRQTGASLYHSPSFSSPVACPCPWILTLHDLNHLHYGNVIQKMYYACVVKPFARRARALVTVSESSRREISQWLGTTVSGVSIVPNAFCADQERGGPVPEFVGSGGLVPGRYFFCIANPKPHKNLPFLITTFQMARDRGLLREWKLVILGVDGVSGDGVIRRATADSRELEWLLSHSGCLLSPSLYEGFGRTSVEALLKGIPVVLSDIPVHREILADLPLETGIQYAAPQDGDAWIAALCRVADGLSERPSEELRERLGSRYSPKMRQRRWTKSIAAC